VSRRTTKLVKVGIPALRRVHWPPSQPSARTPPLKRLLAVALALSSLAFGAPRAHAAEQGAILRIEGPDMYVALGRLDGVASGSELLIYKQIAVRDPAGRRLEEAFLVGKVLVLESADRMSRVRGDPQLLVAVTVGDLVRFAPPVREPLATRVAPVEAGPAQAPDERELVETFQRNAGQPPDVRIAAWSEWQARWPASAHATAAGREIEAARRERLRATISGAPVVSDPTPAMEASAPVAAAVVQEEAPTARLVESKPKPTRALPLAGAAVSAPQAPPGQDAAVLLAVADPDDIVSATAFWRPADESDWRPVPMERYGDASWMARLPTGSATATAAEVWIAAVDHDGAEVHAAGGPYQARRIALTPRGGPTDDRSGRTTLRVRADRESYAGLGPDDQVNRLDLTLSYAVEQGALDQVRVGYGLWSGTTSAGAAVDLRFAHVGLSLWGTNWAGLEVDGLFGMDRDGPNAGTRAALRLGRRERAALIPALASWGSAGTSARLDLAWGTIPRVPMRAGVDVTNRPLNANGGTQGRDATSLDDNLGVVLDVEPTFELSPRLELGLRLGYSLRDIVDPGPALGASMALRW
jgi:hypothetical protein